MTVAVNVAMHVHNVALKTKTLPSSAQRSGPRMRVLVGARDVERSVARESGVPLHLIGRTSTEHQRATNGTFPVLSSRCLPFTLHS